MLNERVVKYSCMSLRHITEGSTYSIDAILDDQLGILPKLIELLVGNTSTSILWEAIKILTSIVSSDDLNHTQFVLIALPSLLWLLDHPDYEIRREVCSTLYFITTGTKEQIQAVIDAAVFPKLIEILKSGDV